MKIKNTLSLLLCVATIALTLIFHERLEEKIPHLHARNVNAAEDFMPDSLYAGIVSQTYQYNHKIITGEISLDDLAPFSEDESIPFYRDTVPGAPVPHGLANGVRNTPRDSISVVLAVVSAVLPTSIVPFLLTPALRWMFTTMPTKRQAMLLPRHPLRWIGVI